MEGTTNEVINLVLEYGSHFSTPSGPNELRVSLSLDSASNSGTEDLIGVAIKDLPHAPPGLDILNITTGIMPEATLPLSPTRPDARIAYQQVRLPMFPGGGFATWSTCPWTGIAGVEIALQRPALWHAAVWAVRGGHAWVDQ